MTKTLHIRPILLELSSLVNEDVSRVSKKIAIVVAEEPLRISCCGVAFNEIAGMTTCPKITLVIP